MIIDELLVRLGWKVDEKGIEEFKEHAKGAIGWIKELAEAAGVAAIGEFVKSTVENVAGVKKFGETVGMSARNVQALGIVAAENESNLEGMEGTIESLTAMTGQAARGIGRAAMIFKKLGLHAKNSKGEVKGFTEVFGDIAELMQGKSRPEQLGLAARLGIDPHLINLLVQGREAVEGYTAAAEKRINITEGDYEEAAKVEKEFISLNTRFAVMRAELGVKLLPIVNLLTKAFIGWFDRMKKSKDIQFMLSMVGRLTFNLLSLTGSIIKAISQFNKLKPIAIALKVIFGIMLANTIGIWFFRVGGMALGAARGVGKLLFTMKGLKNILTGGLIGLILLLAEDLWVFYAGGVSVTGMLVKKWAPAIKAVWAAMVLLVAILARAQVVAIASAARAAIVWTASAAKMVFSMLRVGAVSVATASRSAIAWAAANLPLIAMIALFAAAFYAGYKLGEVFSGLINKSSKLRKALGLDPGEVKITDRMKGFDEAAARKKLKAMGGPHAAPPEINSLNAATYRTAAAGAAHEATVTKAGGGSHKTTVHQTKIGTVKIVTDDPSKMHKEWNRRVVRNGQTSVGY